MINKPILSQHILFISIVTIYFLYQRDKSPLGSTIGNGRRFKDLDEFLKLKDDFLNSYSECLKSIAATRAQPPNR
jgi:hypothetical protein